MVELMTTRAILAGASLLVAVPTLAQAANVGGCRDLVAGRYPYERLAANTPYNIAPSYVAGDEPLVDGASTTFSAASRDELRATYATVAGRLYRTTDELIHFAACITGQPLKLTRARVYTESSYRQGFCGDGGASCGVLQVKGSVHDGTWPKAVRSTLANLLYANLWQRACRTGEFDWLGSAYRASSGDARLWGCVGAWYSGKWNDTGSLVYQGDVRSNFGR